MPKIRSVTVFTNIDPLRATPAFEGVGRFLPEATTAIEATGIPVQTRRLATQPFPLWTDAHDAKQLLNTVASVWQYCQGNQVDYLSIGPVRQTDPDSYVTSIAAIFAAMPGVFAGVDIANREHGIDLKRLAATARLNQEISHITPDGMTSVYLAALANCQPGAPFFPVAYHDGGDPAFALAVQAADLAVQAFHQAPDGPTARQRLTDAIQTTADQLVPVAERLAAAHHLRFLGFDFSLAPYPVDEESLGGALEALGVRFGGAGLVAAASLVMNAVEAADFPRAGFCGLMLPILEDSVLATRTAEGRLSLNDLLLLSTVCGTGLDCIPLPGDIAVTVLRDILLDIAALSLRLDKPLTARLMPFPGKVAGDDVEFAWEYFADSKILPAPISPATNFGLHGSDATRLHILPRKSNT